MCLGVLKTATKVSPTGQEWQYLNVILDLMEGDSTRLAEPALFGGARKTCDTGSLLGAVIDP